MRKTYVNCYLVRRNHTLVQIRDNRVCGGGIFAAERESLIEPLALTWGGVVSPILNSEVDLLSY